jgi:hypothetical protein
VVRWITPAAVVLLATVTPASGHVAPSENENNRYLKLTPLGDRVRLAYTIYFGEVPGAALRRQMDTDGDGLVGEAEANKLGLAIAAEVQPRVSLTLDGVDVPVGWSEIEVGMGTPEVRAGSFAIDLLATVCLPSRGTHELVLRDDYALPIPGETELKVDAGLGVKIERISLGDSAVNGDEVKLRGVGGPLAEGWLVKVAIGDAAPVGGGSCSAAAPVHKERAGRWMILLGLVAAALAAVLLVVAKRRRR